MKKSISHLFATAIMALAFVTSGFAAGQTDLGAACGCPTPVSSRTQVNISTLTDNSAGATDGNLLNANTILTCDKTWILNKRIFVIAGQTLVIQPGTVIAASNLPSASAAAIVVGRGGKIIADGNPDCQIVFTAIGDVNLDGTYGINHKGEWAGIVIAGRATNNTACPTNCTFAPGAGDGKLGFATGLAGFEGFATADSRMRYGADITGALGPVETFDDNDNSGILSYVSIRHAGANLTVGGEINALSLGSVGRGTTIDHVEIISCADDGIELWGGTVNLKHLAVLFGNDDMIDWDNGWRGNVQFFFGLTTPDTGVASIDADNAMECDADDQKSNLLPRSHPVVFNATIIGNGKDHRNSDNSGPAGIQAKEMTEGEISNSVFANFRYGLQLVKAVGSRTGGFEAYHNWANTGGNGSNSLKVKCNTFVGCGRNIAIDVNFTGTLLTTDSTQFYNTDLNIGVPTLAGFTHNWAMNSSTNVVSTKFDAVPNPALSASGCPVAPLNGFFTPANYRGAFGSGKNWLSPWAFAQVINATSGLVACPTDINADGTTNNVDFLQLLGQFNQSCQ